METMQPVVECCAPLLDEPIAPGESEQLAGWFGVLADPTRLRLLSLIAAQGEACAACDLVEPLGVSQPTVSHHLTVLREAGLVESERRGRWVYYRPVPERLAILSRALGA
ncbi:MAG: metalloregulator ArsR/SmtB family transcription factor [Acidimicrobiia bacterium]|nr:metalloregulator ArsR/SmtB family transcription factor [Acidimicrobiia bacterium]